MNVTIQKELADRIVADPGCKDYGAFKAYDSANGNLLWKFQAGAGVNAPPASYTVNGKQYVVVGAGGNVQLNFKRGNNIIAFTLAD